MGEDIPDEPPGYEEGKFWCCTLVMYIGDEGQGIVRCCKEGSVLNAWIAAAGDGHTILCSGPPIEYEVLTMVEGPYDTFGICANLCLG